MIRKLIVTAGLLVSGVGFGNVQESAALEIYKNRAQGEPHITDGINAYKNLLNSTTDTNSKIFYATQVARLHVIKGEALTSDSALRQREEIFEKCYNDIDVISPRRLGNLETEQYHYFKVACAGLWAKAEFPNAGIFDLLRIKGRLERAASDAEDFINELDELNFEGGGVARVLAFLYSSDEVRGNSTQLDQPAKALRMINKAIESTNDTSENPLYGDIELTGYDYADNFYVKGQVLNRNNREVETRFLLNDEFEGQIPFFMEMIQIHEDPTEDEIEILNNRLIETKHAVKRMEEVLSAAGN